MPRLHGIFAAKSRYVSWPATYFCTPIEAEREGYSAKRDVYDFPHLYEAGEPTKYMREHGITEYAK